MKCAPDKWLSQLSRNIHAYQILDKQAASGCVELACEWLVVWAIGAVAAIYNKFQKFTLSTQEAG